MTNQEFIALPVGKQRVEIAKDILKQIEWDIFIPQTGAYVERLTIDGVNPDSFSDLSEESVQDKYERIESCKVCAIGACVLAATKYKNKVIFADVTSSAHVFKASENIREVLSDVFTAKQLLLIECSFEGFLLGRNSFAVDTLDKSVELTEAEGEACLRFNHKYENDTEILVAIMENIVKNNGRFRIH